MTAPTEFYEACSIKRQRRSKADIEAIKSAIFDVLNADNPMTIRQAFYQLIVRYVIEKTEEQFLHLPATEVAVLIASILRAR
jgi:hypothetical protein